MFLGDDMYFGNDRLALLKAAISRQRNTGKPA
jgi:2-hydroxychromene-2-carboxylate isomerase